MLGVSNKYIESQVPVPVPVPMSQVQVQVPVLQFQVPVPVQVLENGTKVLIKYHAVLQPCNNLIPDNCLKNLTQLTGKTNRSIVSRHIPTFTFHSPVT